MDKKVIDSIPIKQKLCERVCVRVHIRAALWIFRANGSIEYSCDISVLLKTVYNKQPNPATLNALHIHNTPR